jgi:hypothetical protein
MLLFVLIYVQIFAILFAINFIYYIFNNNNYWPRYFELLTLQVGYLSLDQCFLILFPFRPVLIVVLIIHHQ